MKLRMTAALCVLVLLTTARADDKKADELEGVWIVTGMIEDGGEETKPPEVSKLTFQASGKAVTQTGERVQEATYTTDATKKPATLDVSPSDPKIGKTVKLLYKLEGDTLTLCRTADPKGSRPTEFTAAKGSKQVLITLKREKK